ncbi:MAG TPA: hypothetical protein VFA88_09845 [Gaiellaceae bacterium]|nr:hypothetical protein [Gaiellaceae bacterium]
MHDDEEVPIVSVTPTAPPPPGALEAPEPFAGNGPRGRHSFLEAIIDNLSFWTVLSAGIGLLYLVWMTLEILSRYVGHLPSVGP